LILSAASIVFPHQLYQNHPALSHGRPVYLVEEWLYFHQYRFHKQKLLLHRSTMQMYADYLQQQGYEVRYIAATSPTCDVQKLIPQLVEISELHYTAVVDDWLQQRLVKTAGTKIKLIEYPSPNFLNEPNEVEEFFASRKSYKQTDFYIDQRKRRQILIDDNGKPMGGKWTYDADNRQKYPKNQIPPIVQLPSLNNYVKEAQVYVDRYFPDNYGSTQQPFAAGYYPTTFTEAEEYLQDFLQVRLRDFGAYEDAMVSNQSILHHSLLTPMLNIGLLTPQQILTAVLTVSDEIPLNSLEGFIRQIIGWREFIRLTYERVGRQQRTHNYWKFSKSIPPVSGLVKLALNL
jgi:deoxyribodipyrimidine photolyase-related protein